MLERQNACNSKSDTKMNTEPFTSLEWVIGRTNALALRDERHDKLVESVRRCQAAISELITQAETITVTDQSENQRAALVRTQLKEWTELTEDLFQPHVSAAHEVHSMWTTMRGLVVNPAKDAAHTLKRACLDFEAEQERQRLAEQARLQAEADELARKERERLEKEAARLKTPEKKAERLAAAAAVVPPVVFVPKAAPVVSSRRKWVVTKFEKNVFIRNAAVSPVLLGYCEEHCFPNGNFRELVLSAQRLCSAKAANPELELPGITFRQDVV